ncbi:MAG: hypothetical protein GYA35_09855 [Thermoanaerobaculaceae bacterium]|nr:hypothetical protein [Thermoanaerobaculaceae bacterium]
MKKPKKDKELPSVLSEKSISKIISSVDNLKHIADILAKLECIRTIGADINKLGERARKKDYKNGIKRL